MPTGRPSARPLLIRRVAEPSRDPHALLAQTYERLIGIPAASPGAAALETSPAVGAPPVHPAGHRASSRPELTPAGISVA